MMKRSEGSFTKLLMEAATRDGVGTVDEKVKDPDTEADPGIEVDPEVAEEDPGRAEVPADTRAGEVAVKAQRRRRNIRKAKAEVKAKAKRRNRRAAEKEAKVKTRF